MTDKRRLHRVVPCALLAAAFLLVATASRDARAASRCPNIASVYPAGAQKGTTVKVTVSGVSLKGATAVRITGKGMTGKVLPPKPVDPKARKRKIKATKTSEEREEETIELSVTVAPDALPGLRELRVITPGGISNRYRFFVGQIREVAEKEPNSKKDQAQPLGSLPAVANGQIMSSDKDIFRFQAKAGQTIVCEVKAQDIQPFIPDAVPGWFQAALTLYAADGRELMYVDDFRFKPDPVLIYKVPADGEYLIEIRDAIYRGRNDFIYRLSVGALPYITHLYPLGGPRKSTAQIKLTGANLPKRKLDLKLTDGCPAVRRVDLAAGPLVSNALPFGVGEGKEIAEAPKNDAREKAQKIEAPVTVNGRIERPGDVDYFALTVKAKQTLVLEVRARRLDSPLDSKLAVLNATGRELIQNDDAIDEAEQLITHHADSRVAYTFPAAGEYFVRLEDVQGKGGQEYAYRLRVAPPRPDFAMRVVPDNPYVAPGETAVLTAEAVRIDGFSGEVRLAMKNLPKGFVVRGAAIPAKEKEVRFSITAPASAKPGIFRPGLTGTAKIGGRDVVRQAAPAEQIQQAFSYTHRVPTSEMLLAVVEPGPFALTADLPPGGVVKIVQNGEAKVVVKAVRREPPAAKPAAKKPAAKKAPAKKAPAKKPPAKKPPAAIRLKADEPPRNVTVRAKPIAAGKNEATVTIRASRALPVGYRQNIIISGTMRVGKDNIVAYAPAIPIEVIAPPSKAKPKPKPAVKAPAKKPAARTTKPKPKPTAKKTKPKPPAKKPPAKATAKPPTKKPASPPKTSK